MNIILIQESIHFFVLPIQPPCIPSLETNDTILSLETIRSSTSSPALEDSPWECQQAVHEFITDTTCSARLEFTVDSLLTESLNADEYRKLFSQVCKSQRCLNRLVKVLDICMKAQGFGKKNRIMVCTYDNNKFKI